MTMYSDFQGTYEETIQIGLKTNYIGFRTNGGVAEFRNFGGSWIPIPSGGYFELNTVPTPNVVRQPSGYNQDFVFGSTQLDDTGIADHRSRFFFDESKGAFRAGYTSSNQWDDANRGDYSVAFGASCRASGMYSFASGTTTIASGMFSFAHGTSCNVSGVATVAFGSGGVHSGNYSGSFGSGHSMTGSTSFTAGSSNNISGSNSAALGSSIAISENYIFGAGQGHTLATRYSSGFGINARSYWYGQQVFASGSTSADGDSQHSKIHYYGAGAGGWLNPGNNTANTIMLQTNKSYGFKVVAMGTCVTAGGGVSVGDTCKFEIDVVARNIAGTSTIISHLVNTICQPASMSTTSASMSMTGNEIRLNVVNPAGCTMRWTATAHVEEIGW